MKKILFVCVENAGRSQMAEAFAKKYGAGNFAVSSAGNKPQLITAKMAMDADLIVTMGCNDQGVCPGPLLKPTLNWVLEDPKGKPVEKVREIRDEIERRVKKLFVQPTAAGS